MAPKSAGLAGAGESLFLRRGRLACRMERRLPGRALRGRSGERICRRLRRGVFSNGRQVDALAISVTGMRVLPVVSQGCKPIGEPLTVTKAENNVDLFAGHAPGLRGAGVGLRGPHRWRESHREGQPFRRAGRRRSMSEDFKSGDFLIRNILGADPNSGAVASLAVSRGWARRCNTSCATNPRPMPTGAPPLRHAASESGRPPVASLLFACAGRGAGLFGCQSHDASLLEEIVGAHASAGFFGNGEIAPLGGKNYIHSYTAACALFYRDEIMKAVRSLVFCPRHPRRPCGRRFLGAR